MYNGNPVSVVVFNIVMNALVDNSMRIDFGYKFSGSLQRLNIL